jgi:hypothetical protein
MNLWIQGLIHLWIRGFRNLWTVNHAFYEPRIISRLPTSKR